MRVVIASDSIGPLSSLEAARALAAGWSAGQVELIAMAEAGRGFVQAVADAARSARETSAGSSLGTSLGTDSDPRLQSGPAVLVGRGPGLRTILDSPERLAIAVEPVVVADSAERASIDPAASSGVLGHAVRDGLLASRHRSQQLLVDLTGVAAHDGGAGFLAALGARVLDPDRPEAGVEAGETATPLTRGVEGLADIRGVDLGPVRSLLAGRELIAVTRAGEESLPLLGLRGITSLRGRESGMPAPEMLRIDAALETFADALAESIDDRERPRLGERPGSGAHGGLGLAVLALGGRLATGPQVCAELSGLDGRLRGADLVVTGCERYDFAHRGGGVVAEVARRAADALAPCIVCAGEVMIGAREMRTMGIESAYPMFESESHPPVSAERLSALASRVARSWSW